MKTLGSITLFLCMFASSGFANEDNADEEWDISFSPLEPYFWLANTSADVTLGGSDVPIDLDFFEDAVSNMGEGLQFRIEIHLDASKSKWTLLLDPTRLTADSFQTFEDVGEFDISTRSTFKMTDVKVGYEVWENIDIFAGLRYTSQDIRLNSDLLPERLKGTKNWWAGVAGVRYRTSLTENWSFSAGAFTSGFLDSDDERSADANFIFRYDFSEWFDMNFGYRVLHVRFSSGSDETLFKYDATYRGPLVGVNIKFF